MSINIGNYNFDGPFSDTSKLKNQSGVYVILGRNSGTETWNVIDIGESATMCFRVESHDRSPCWTLQRYSQLQVAAYYCNEQQRMKIERDLRDRFNPPCGER